jgi:hypothetical protein
MAMQRIKICPDCLTEYYPHIENCADCGAVLLLPEEIKKAQDKKKLCREKALENQVVVREGDLKWMSELSHVLIDSGISCAVRTDAGCSKGRCGHTHYLLVSSQDAEKAHEKVEEYYAEIHPEIQASKEMLNQGKCPACGSHADPDAAECPDCGLTLLIIE